MEKVKLVFKLIVNTLVLLLLIEVFLRIFFPLKSSNEMETAAYTPHPEYLVALKPNIKKKYIHSKNNGGDTIYWGTNKNAFRGADIQEKDMRIMVYGDSNIQARFSNLEHTFPQQLEMMINQYSDKTIEVINAGVVGFGPDQSLIKFIEEKDSFKPDLVILQIFADNDFGDLIRNRLFKIDEHGKLVKSGAKKILDPAFQKYQKREKPWRYLRLIDGVNKIRRIVKSKKDTISPDRMIGLCTFLCEDELKTYDNQNTEVHSHFADHYDIDVASQPNSRASERKIDLMEKILQRFKAEAMQSEIQLLVLIEPSVVDLTTNAQMSYRELQQRYPAYKPKNLTNIIENACNKHGIAYINLFESFADNTPEQLYFKKGNDHWTDAAQQLAARITSEQLYKNLYFNRDSKITPFKDEE